MIKIGPNYVKLKTSLQLASTRLKILQSKKLELAEKRKLEVAKDIKSGKYLKAKLSAQTIIRDEAAVEAMELIEMYCKQILERYELFQQMKVPDVSLVIPITSLIWVAPYYQNYVEELKVISKQLDVKYGTRIYKMALTNKTGGVNPELIEKVSQFMPSDEKVEDCLRNICSKLGIVCKINEEKSSKSNINNDEKEFNSNSKTLNVSEGNTKFHDKGISKIDESISKKKRFSENMLKFKIKKTARQNQDGIDEICHDAFSMENSKQSLSASEIEDECGTITNLLNSRENYFDGSYKLEDSLEDNIHSEAANKNSSGNSFFDDCYGKIPEKHDVSPHVGSHFYTDEFRIMYSDPPPPYNFHYFPEGEVYGRNGTWQDFLEFQLPTCPTENPGPPSALEIEEQRKKKEKCKKIY